MEKFHCDSSKVTMKRQTTCVVYFKKMQFNMVRLEKIVKHSILSNVKASCRAKVNQPKAETECLFFQPILEFRGRAREK